MHQLLETKNIKIGTVIRGCIWTVLVWLVFILVDYILCKVSDNGIVSSLGDSFLRFLFSVPAVILMVKIYGCKIKQILNIKGFGKGMFAALFVWTMCIAVVIVFICCTEKYKSVTLLSVVLLILTQISTGFMEEGLFRGLFMEGMLRKYGNSMKGRLVVVFISGTVFGSAHLINVFFGNSLDSAVSNVFFASLSGIAYAAIYMYSQNLIAAIVVHAVYDIFIHFEDLLILQYKDNIWMNITNFIGNASFVLMVVFAVYLCYKAKDRYK